MVWLYEDMKDTHPKYSSWLRKENHITISSSGAAVMFRRYRRYK